MDKPYQGNYAKTPLHPHELSGTAGLPVLPVFFHEPVQTLLHTSVVITPADTASRFFLYDDSHSRFVFDIEHPHHFTTVASGLLGWCSSGETLDARANIKEFEKT